MSLLFLYFLLFFLDLLTILSSSTRTSMADDDGLVKVPPTNMAKCLGLTCSFVFGQQPMF